MPCIVSLQDSPETMPQKKGNGKKRNGKRKNGRSYASRLADKKINTAVERAAKRIAKQEDDKQIEWKQYRFAVGQVGTGAGWAQYQEAAGAGWYNFITGIWTGNQATTSTTLTSIPQALYLMDINKQTFKPGAGGNLPTYHEDLGGIAVQGAVLPQRPNQLRLTDTIKIKNIHNIVEVFYSPPVVGQPLDDRGFIDVYLSLVRCSGVIDANPTFFHQPLTALQMKRPKFHMYSKLLDIQLRDQEYTGKMFTLDSKKIRIRTGLTSQKSVVHLNWTPKNYRQFRYVLGVDTPSALGVPNEPMKEAYFLHMYTESPAPALQQYPAQGGARVCARTYNRVLFADAQV